jgi:hypothetical protein
MNTVPPHGGDSLRMTSSNDHQDASDLLQPFSGISPLDLFREVCVLGKGPEARAMKVLIDQHCARNGYKAFIEYHEDDGWVFYRILEGMNGKGLVRPDLHRYFIDKRFADLCASEKMMEDALVSALALTFSEQEIARQISIPAGVIDVVACSWIFELKRELTRPALQQAIGQLVLYAASYSLPEPSEKVVIGRDVGVLDAGILAAIRHVGIHVLCWPDERYKEDPVGHLRHLLSELRSRQVAKSLQQAASKLEKLIHGHD